MDYRERRPTRYRGQRCTSKLISGGDPQGERLSPTEIAGCDRGEVGRVSAFVLYEFPEPVRIWFLQGAVLQLRNRCAGQTEASTLRASEQGGVAG